MRCLSKLAVLFAVFALSAAAHKSSAPFVPVRVLEAKTIAVVVYWPNVRWEDKAEIQAEGEDFLRKWNRYEVVHTSDQPDLVALVAVEQVSHSGGFWRTLAYALAVGAQAYARSAQNYEHCEGQISGQQVGNIQNYQVDSTCYGYTPQSPAAVPPPAPRYVLGGTIMLFDGKFLQTGAPIPEPLLFANADNRGSKPLIAAGNRLRKMIEDAQKALPDRMATVNALMAKVHELAVANRMPQSDETGCDTKIAQQIGTHKEMLSRVEHRDFEDVGKLFQELCEPAPLPK